MYPVRCQIKSIEIESVSVKSIVSSSYTVRVKHRNNFEDEIFSEYFSLFIIRTKLNYIKKFHTQLWYQGPHLTSMNQVFPQDELCLKRIWCVFGAQTSMVWLLGSQDKDPLSPQAIYIVKMQCLTYSSCLSVIKSLLDTVMISIFLPSLE